MKNKQNRKLKYFLVVLGVYWTIALAIAIFQGLIMFRNPLIFLTIILLPLPIYLHFLLYKKAEKNKRTAIILLYIYALINFFPLILQLLKIKPTGIDNIITALIGLILIYLKK